MATGAPEISLGQKYLTTFNPFGISNYGPESIRDLISLTSPIDLMTNLGYIFGIL